MHFAERLNSTKKPFASEYRAFLAHTIDASCQTRICVILIDVETFTNTHEYCSITE